MYNVVVINGGRGAAALIPKLLEKDNIYVTSIVNAYDDGKSTGEIRRFFSMLGPSDIRKVQELMLPKEDKSFKGFIQFFKFRFNKNCSRDEAINKIQDIIDDRPNDILDQNLIPYSTRKSISIMLGEFIKQLKVNEVVMNEVFNFSDCSIMNCVYAGAFIYFKRNIEKATHFIDKLFRLRGKVISTSNENKHLVALRENGEVLFSEAEIVELRSNVRIDKLFLIDNPLNKDTFERLSNEDKSYYLSSHHCYVTISTSVSHAINQADIIIYSAGTQHSSLYPSYLSIGMAESISNNRSALKVFITNIGADYETPSYKASDYIKSAYKYLNLSGSRNYSMKELFDEILINKSKIKANETYVEYDDDGFIDIDVKCHVDCYESIKEPGKHDGEMLVNKILELQSKKENII